MDILLAKSEPASWKFETFIEHTTKATELDFGTFTSNILNFNLLKYLRSMEQLFKKVENIKLLMRVKNEIFFFVRLLLDKN